MAFGFGVRFFGLVATLLSSMLILWVYRVITVQYRDCADGKAMRDKRARVETVAIIHLRATTEQKILIDRAAEASGGSRSDFMLHAAYQEAESVLLDRRHFALSKQGFKRFKRILGSPPNDKPTLRRLLQTKAPWDR